MSEETDALEGGAEGVESEAVETTSEATTEQPTETETSDQADDAGEATAEAPKKVPWFQKRIDEVTARKYEAEREAAYWRGIAEARTAPPQQQEKTPPDRWEDPDGYDQWLIEKAAKLARQQASEDMQRQSSLRTYGERETRARQTHPDYDHVVSDPTLPITPLMADIIRDSETGPEVAYHLGVNRQEAQRIAGLPPHLQAKELGRIEAALSKPPERTQKPIPPAPPQTVGGVSAGLRKSYEEMSMAEYVKTREAELKT
jgi:hypothetical protein